MKIGIFDSGLGGLVVLKELKRQLPQYNYLYLGDTKNLPYGNKSQKQIYQLAVKAAEYLFRQDCELIIIACNTVSSEALRKLQREYLPQSKYSQRKILGIIRPTVEAVGRKIQRVGVIGTNRTIDSKAYLREFKKSSPKFQVYQVNTPLLVPLIESQRLGRLPEVLGHYLKPLLHREIQTLILGCTHYGLILPDIKKVLPKNVTVVAQEHVLSGKLKNYLARHGPIKRRLAKNAKIELQITKANPLYLKLAKQWFGNEARLKIIKD